VYFQSHLSHMSQVETCIWKGLIEFEFLNPWNVN
jgi:hypothetical protein